MLTIILLIFALYHIISWSGGKDSTATIILFKLHWNEIMKPGDKAIIVFAEVMYDAKRNISGHNPDVIKFMYEKAKIFEAWGFEVRFLRADGKRKDFLDFFYHIMGRSPEHPEHEGMIYGFPDSGECGVKRDLKLKPIDDFKKEMEKHEHIDYVGIAKDEPDRLVSLYKQPNTVSLLDKYGYTEERARRLCEKNNMLSPQYFLGINQSRDGCWFCPNAKLCEHKAVKDVYPDIWKEYVELENVPNVAYNKWYIYSKETLHERDAVLSDEKAYARYLEEERQKALKKQISQKKKVYTSIVKEIKKILEDSFSTDEISWMQKSEAMYIGQLRISAQKGEVSVSNQNSSFTTKSGKRWYCSESLVFLKEENYDVILDKMSNLTVNVETFLGSLLSEQKSFVFFVKEDRYIIDKLKNIA